MSAISRSHKAAPSPARDDISLALQRTLTRYSTAVRDAARRHGLSESDIDEVFQDVRIRLWRALTTGERISDAPASYVYRTAVSAALDLIRRRRARREDSVDWMESRIPARARSSPESAVEAADLQTRLSGALADLSESRRVVVRMHLLGYHRDEIARLLGWTEAKTRNLLYRGLAELKAKLGVAETRLGITTDR